MLLRRLLNPRFHSFNLTTPAPFSRQRSRNGTHANISTRLLSDSTSTSSNTISPENWPDVSSELYAHLHETPSQETGQPRQQSPSTTPTPSHEPTSTSSRRGRELSNEQVLREALESGEAPLINCAVKKILLDHEEQNRRFRGPTQDLLLRHDVLSALYPRNITSLLTSMTSRRNVRDVFMPPNTIWHIVGHLFHFEQPREVKEPLSLLHPVILKLLQQSRRANLHSVSYTPPDIVRSAILFTYAYLGVNEKQAMIIFKALLKSGHIPSEAMVESSSSQTPEEIVRVSLVKASAHWGWSDVTVMMLGRLLHSSSPSTFILRHATECLHFLLYSPSPGDLKHIFRMLYDLHHFSPLPDSLIHRFYDGSVEVSDLSEAARLYAFSRQESILAAHYYPAPRGRALGELMLELAKNKKTQLVRALATDILQNSLPIPLVDRAPIITVVAEAGISSSARALWEMYATGRDGSLVYGDAKVMLRMVSLFTKLAQTEEGTRNNGAREPDDIQRQKVSDLKSFARHVMAEFAKHHQPWMNADHRLITSYARACFIIGENTEGFDVFKILLRRSELPDLYDVNVSLSAIAKQSPGTAAKVIKRMESNGMTPDAVTFGTVLHYASVQNRGSVVNEMISRLSQLESWRSDVQVFGAMVRAVVRPVKDESHEDLVNKLKSAWELVRRSSDVGKQTSTQIGNYLVRLSLQAKDPLLAFRFWRALVKEGEEYDDARQRKQRSAIIALVLKQNMRGGMSGHDARTIVTALRRSGEIEPRIPGRR